MRRQGDHPREHDDGGLRLAVSVWRGDYRRLEDGHQLWRALLQDGVEELEQPLHLGQVRTHVIAEMRANQRFDHGVRPVDVKATDEQEKLDNVVKALVVVKGRVLQEHGINDTREGLPIG